jgi:hypothetical protein
MSNTVGKIIIPALAFCFLLAGTSHSQLLGTACEPYGSISIKDEPAADNIPVVAYINGQEMARCLTQGGQYSLFVPKDDADTAEKDGWADGDNIVIYVNGIEAHPSFEAQSGRIRVDLTVSALGIKLDTWGKIKALFK